MSMTFARHETFHIRTGWLRKGIKAIEKEPHIFLEEVGDAMELLGIGKNMISSLRYWLQATNITSEEYESSIKVQKKTAFGEIIKKYDDYLEDIGTFWLIHFYLAANKELATTWYWFFNHFHYEKFDKELLLSELEDFIKREGEEVPAKRSLTRDINVLIRMYLYKPEDHKSPEDTMESPFTELRLLTEEDGLYLYNKPSHNLLPPHILYYCVLENNKDRNAVNIEEILYKDKSVGKIFDFKPTDIYSYLEWLESLGYVNVSKQAGLNSVNLKIKSQRKVLEDYYNKG